MSVAVAVFTPRPPVSLFESVRRSLGTTFENLIQPSLYAEVDGRGQVRDLRNSTAVITALKLSNVGGASRTVDFQIRSTRRITYQAEVVAQAGQNSLRLDRTTSARGVSLFGYDWTATPAPVQLIDGPEEIVAITRDVAWTSDSRYLAATAESNRFRIYDAQDDFATVYTSPAAPSPVRTVHCVWSPDDRYLVVSYRFADNVTHPFIKVFDFDDITAPVEVTIPDIETRVTQEPNAIAWGGPAGTSAPLGRYMVATHTGPERVSVWDWDSGAPVYSSTLSTALSTAAGVGGVAASIAFSRGTASARLAFTHGNPDRLSVFNFPTATSVSKIVDSIFAANVPRSSGRKSLVWTYDNRYLVAMIVNDPVPFVMFDFQSGVSVRTPPPPQPPALPTLMFVEVSPDGRYVVLGHSESARYTYYSIPLPYLLLYDYQSGTPVRVTNAPRLQGFGAALAARFSPDNSVLMVAGQAYDRFYPPTGVDNVQLLDSGGTNHVVNGSFEDTTGMTRDAFGFTAVNEIVGWYSDGAPAAPDGELLFFPDKRLIDAFPTQGRVYFDPVSRSLFEPQVNNPRLRQDFDDLIEGATYRLRLDVTASLQSDVGAQVRWNGSIVNIDGAVTLPITEDFTLLSVTVPPGESVEVPVERHMLAYGDTLQAKASGAGIDCVVSYILSTQEKVETLPDSPLEPEEEISE
jgi:WD40 repeat protein